MSKEANNLNPTWPDWLYWLRAGKVRTRCSRLHVPVKASLGPGRGYEAKLRAEAVTAPILGLSELVAASSGGFVSTSELRTVITEAMAQEAFERATRIVAGEFGLSSGRFRKVRLLAIVV